MKALFKYNLKARENYYIFIGVVFLLFHTFHLGHFPNINAFSRITLICCYTFLVTMFTVNPHFNMKFIASMPISPRELPKKLYCAFLLESFYIVIFVFITYFIISKLSLTSIGISLLPIMVILAIIFATLSATVIINKFNPIIIKILSNITNVAVLFIPFIRWSVSDVYYKKLITLSGNSPYNILSRYILLYFLILTLSYITYYFSKRRFLRNINKLYR